MIVEAAFGFWLGWQIAKAARVLLLVYLRALMLAWAWLFFLSYLVLRRVAPRRPGTGLLLADLQRLTISVYMWAGFMLDPYAFVHPDLLTARLGAS